MMQSSTHVYMSTINNSNTIWHVLKADISLKAQEIQKLRVGLDSAQTWSCSPLLNNNRGKQ